MSLNDMEVKKFMVNKKDTSLYDVRTQEYSSGTGTSLSVNAYLINGTGIFCGAEVFFNSSAVGAIGDKVEVKDSTANAGAVIATILSSSAAIDTRVPCSPQKPIQVYNGLYFAVTTATAGSAVTINTVYK